HDAHDVLLVQPAVEESARDAAELLPRGLVRRLRRVDALEERIPVLAEDDVEDLVLRREVVVEQTVRDTRLLCDVADARRMEALAREHAHGRVEEQTP